ncbi:hypothetical protein SELSPUOL_01646 [Selenomonas sputigena ATCC 35185]|uniref:Uncharacterized protein n=1 Tax=Selenomonas sputigena (strain ATCC 35185 / DSM 20758 / CCUG 44933 / VPI D19B-28) TaxID=546271 RepID=C9LVZ4_SELS3|nr:hypothetical protein SELSPUOL_01646 [Selenomonas sputigena ATCC 35185]
MPERACRRLARAKELCYNAREVLRNSVATTPISPTTPWLQEKRKTLRRAYSC